MLTNSLITAIIPVTDLELSSQFYGETLGLKQEQKIADGILYSGGNGTKLYLYQRAPSSSSHTLAGFEVSNIESVVAGLKNKGVKFEEYDQAFPPLKTINGIATFGNVKSAWFKDPDGNILAVNQTSS